MKQDLIYKMLFSEEKVELSSEKIELGVAEDIEKQVGVLKDLRAELRNELNNLNDANKAIIAANKAADKAQTKADKVRDKADKANMKAATALDKAEKAAKDLGVDFRQIKGFNELDDLYQRIEGLSKDINLFEWSQTM